MLFDALYMTDRALKIPFNAPQFNLTQATNTTEYENTLVGILWLQGGGVKNSISYSVCIQNDKHSVQPDDKKDREEAEHINVCKLMILIILTIM